jgi:RNA polymerase sigma factor (sigma-70 family)
MILQTKEQVQVPGSGPGGEFEDFFRYHYAKLARALLLMIGDPGEAEELAQEAMARAYERWDRVQLMASPLGYVYRTALNLNRKRIRGLRLRRPYGAVEIPGTDPALVAHARQRVLEALRSLPESQRKVLILVEWVGMTTEEVGRLLGVEPVSIRGRLHRARATLRRRFGGSDE